MTQPTLIHGDLRGVRIPALIVGVIGIVACLAGFFSAHRHEFFAGYLIGYLLVFGAAIGSLGFLLIHQLSGGRWGDVARPAFTAGILTLPLMALLFLPILAGHHVIYPWADEQFRHAHEHHLHHKLGYFSFQWFTIRALAYFAVWITTGFLLVATLRWQDREPNPVRRSRLGAIGGIGLVLLFLTLTFAAVDWMMSLDPLWFSSIYGLQVAAGFGLTAMAVTILVTLGLGRRQRTNARLGRAPEPTWFTRDTTHDFGKLLFMLVCLYAYLTFSQFVIIWSGNLPEEITWYLTRKEPRWSWAPPLLIAIHFAIPFCVLMSRHVKRNVALLTIMALFMLGARVVDLCWLILPSFEKGARPGANPELAVQTGWAAVYAVAALAAVGGLWLALYAWKFKPTPVPVDEDHVADPKAHPEAAA